MERAFRRIIKQHDHRAGSCPPVGLSDAYMNQDLSHRDKNKARHGFWNGHVYLRSLALNERMAKSWEGVYVFNLVKPGENDANKGNGGTVANVSRNANQVGLSAKALEELSRGRLNPEFCLAIKSIADKQIMRYAEVKYFVEWEDTAYSGVNVVFVNLMRNLKQIATTADTAGAIATVSSNERLNYLVGSEIQMRRLDANFIIQSNGGLSTTKLVARHIVFQWQLSRVPELSDVLFYANDVRALVSDYNHDNKEQLRILHDTKLNLARQKRQGSAESRVVKFEKVSIDEGKLRKVTFPNNIDNDLDVPTIPTQWGIYAYIIAYPVGISGDEPGDNDFVLNAYYKGSFVDM